MIMTIYFIALIAVKHQWYETSGLGWQMDKPWIVRILTTVIVYIDFAHFLLPQVDYFWKLKQEKVLEIIAELFNYLEGI